MTSGLGSWVSVVGALGTDTVHPHVSLLLLAKKGEEVHPDDVM